MENTITLTPIPPTNLALNGANVLGSILKGFTLVVIEHYSHTRKNCPKYLNELLCNSENYH
jgi:hypothetical protein